MSVRALEVSSTLFMEQMNTETFTDLKSKLKLFQNEIYFVGFAQKKLKAVFEYGALEHLRKLLAHCASYYLDCSVLLSALNELSYGMKEILEKMNSLGFANLICDAMAFCSNTFVPLHILANMSCCSGFVMDVAYLQKIESFLDDELLSIRSVPILVGAKKNLSEKDSKKVIVQATALLKSSIEQEIWNRFIWQPFTALEILHSLKNYLGQQHKDLIDLLHMALKKHEQDKYDPEKCLNLSVECLKSLSNTFFEQMAYNKSLMLTCEKKSAELYDHLFLWKAGKHQRYPEDFKRAVWYSLLYFNRLSIPTEICFMIFEHLWISWCQWKQ